MHRELRRKGVTLALLWEEITPFLTFSAPTKLIYLALPNVSARWRKPPRYWHEACAEFSIRFGGQFQMLGW